MGRNNFASQSLETLTAPIAAATVVAQGTRVEVLTGLIVPHTPTTDEWFGIVDTDNPVTSLGDQLTRVKVIRNGIVFQFLPAGTVVFGQPVYASAVDAETVQTTNAGGEKLVGYVRELDSVTGAAGVRIKVEIKPAQTA